MMQQTYQEKQHVVGEHVKLFKEVAGTILAVYVVVSAAILYLKYSTPQDGSEEIVCMQDAPITYDWKGELIGNFYHDGVNE
tara:strand:- start:387 stop:629 length:243 start_codon:yes stop_codon:yes gene_type:complete